MGISNRDYARDEPPTYSGGGGFTPANDEWAIRSIIITCVVVFFAQNLTNGLTSWLSLAWPGLAGFEVWRLVTYGFCHDTSGVGHLFWNMFGLWVFSRSLESIYGPRETLAFFLVAVAISGVVEVGVGRATGHPSAVIGASGGLMGFILLAAWHFPTRPIGLLFLPVTFELRWIAAAYVLMDVVQVMGEPDGVAHLAHLSGGLVGFLYFQSGIRILPGRSLTHRSQRPGGLQRFLRRMKPKRRARPGVKLYEPPRGENLDREVDRLLDKINREGRESLTPEENEILLRASEKYRNRV